MLDADGYPEEEDIQKIESWDYRDLPGLFAFIKTVWWMADWGWHEKGRERHISTGGWSGNEEIIGAMRKNHMVWTLTWVQSRRGGHYIFELPEK